MKQTLIAVCRGGLRTRAKLRALHICIALGLGLLVVAPQLLLGTTAETSTLLLLLAAVVVSARVGGLSSGLLTALSGTMVGLFFAGARSTSQAAHLAAGSHLVLFSAIAFVVSWLLRGTRLRLRRQSGLIDAMNADLSGGMITLNEQGRITGVNQGMQDMLGWTEDELRGRDPLDTLVRPQVTDVWQSTEVQVSGRLDLRTLGQSEECTLVCKSGAMMPAVWTVVPVMEDGMRSGWLLTFRDNTERKRAETALVGSEARYRGLVNTLPYAVLVVDRVGSVLMANPQAATLFGYESAAAMSGVSLSSMAVDADVERLEADCQVARLGEPARDIEYQARRLQGSTFPVEVTFSPVPARVGDGTSLLVMARDLTERKVADSQRQLTQRRKMIQHQATSALAGSHTIGEAASNLLQTICESEGWQVGVYWRVNAQRSAMTCQTMWHESPDTGRSFEELNYRLQIARETDLPGKAWASEEAVWVEDLSTERTFSRALVASQAHLRTGICVPIRLRGEVHSAIELFSRQRRPLDEDLLQALASVGTQLAQFLERKQAEKALAYQATHDALTDLPNRTLFQRRLVRGLQAARTNGGHVSLLLLDLDRFKEVNDTFGHQYGDLLLQEVAKRLCFVVREADTVARLGGDEFAVLLPATDESGAQTVARTILSALGQPITLQDHRVDVWASIGIALYPDHALDADVLMQRADVAMYAAKRTKAGMTTYSVEQDEHSAGRLQIIAELREAIDLGCLVLHYQPKVNFRTGKTESVEALVRWPHPRRGLIAPDEFIPVAEQTGLILPLTRWVLESALRQCRAWQQDGIDVRVAVNLSAQSLHDESLTDMVAEILAAQQVDPSQLEIEITESAIMVDSSRALETLRKLHAMKVRIAIDDFGTGYSSLSYLKLLPVDEIKIDKSFVLQMEENGSDTFIAQSVIDLGHNLGLDVVAEGVQSEGSWNLLTGMDCDVAQGYHAGRPVPASELSVWLHSVNDFPVSETLEQTGS